MSHKLMAVENSDPNADRTGPYPGGRAQMSAYQGQQEQWAEELRRADDRCSNFKNEIAEL